MRFYRAKNDKLRCLHCKSSILYGEHYVWMFSYKARRVFTFHIECFRKWADEGFVRRYLVWKDNLNPPKKRGRPKKHDNPEEVNRLKSLLTYHKKAGNISRVGEIEKEIKELEDKEPFLE